MTYGLVSDQGWPLDTSKNNKERQTQDRLQGGRLIQVTNTAFLKAKNRDFQNWPPQGRLYTIQLEMKYTLFLIRI